VVCFYVPLRLNAASSATVCGRGGGPALQEIPVRGKFLELRPILATPGWVWDPGAHREPLGESERGGEIRWGSSCRVNPRLDSGGTGEN